MLIKKSIGMDVGSPLFVELLTDFLKENANVPKEYSHEFKVYLDNGTLYLTDEPMDGLRIGNFQYTHGATWFMPNFSDIPEDIFIPAMSFRPNTEDDEFDDLFDDLGIPKDAVKKSVNITVLLDDDTNTEGLAELADLAVYILMILKDTNREIYDKVVNAILEDKDNESRR